jgi:hypothetical protein
MARSTAIARVTTTAVGLALAVAGCGGNGEPDGVVKDFARAWQSKDYGKACSYLSSSAEAQVVGEALTDGDVGSGDPCEGGLRALLSREAAKLGELSDTEDVDIASDEQNATVTYSAGGRWSLAEVDGKWLISEPLPFVESAP